MLFEFQSHTQALEGNKNLKAASFFVFNDKVQKYAKITLVNQAFKIYFKQTAQ